MMSTRLYSYPPFCTKKPFGPCTFAIATAIVASTSKPASGVSNPSRYSSPAASSPPTASVAHTRAGRNPRLPTKPVAPSNPGPPNAPNAFCAPWPRKTAPKTRRSARTPRSNIGHLQINGIISKSRYLTSNHIGNKFPGQEVPGSDEIFADAWGRAPPPVGGASPGIRCRRAPFAGEHCALRAGYHGVRRAGGAVPQGRAAGVRRAAAHPGRVVEHDLRGGQAREARAGAATSRQHRPPRRSPRAHRRGPTCHPANLPDARAGHATRRLGAAAAGPDQRSSITARAGPGRGQAPEARCRVLEPLPEPQPQRAVAKLVRRHLPRGGRGG